MNRLFALAFHNTNGLNRVERNSHQTYFLPRINLTKFNVLVDGRNFYDQPICDEIRKYDELRKLTTGKGDDYTAGCLLDYGCFKNHYQIIATDLSKQKELDADPRGIQQIEAIYMLGNNAQICTILEKSEETILEFSKGTARIL